MSNREKGKRKTQGVVCKKEKETGDMQREEKKVDKVLGNERQRGR